MKTLVVGDTHGRGFWKYISDVDKEWDKFIFIGDYFDSFDIDAKTQIENFREIIEFKKKHGDKVILLFGNHDFHYLSCVMRTGEAYSGFRNGSAILISGLLEDNLKLMQMCHIQGKYLFSHAGVTNTWLESQEYYPKKMSEKRDLETFINDLFHFKPLAFKFSSRRMSDHYGDDVSHSPIWVRPQSLVTDLVNGYTQIVGHTSVKNIKIDTDSGIVLIDTLHDPSLEFLSITDDKLKVERI